MPPKPKPPPQKSRTSPSSKSLSDKPKPRRKLDRALALEILIAKLESTKTCDWYALSQRLAAPEKEREKEEKAKRKVEKSKKELSGSELHDLYHNVVLPGLKSGRALWLEDEEMDVEEGVGGSSGEEGRVTHSGSSRSARLPAKRKKEEDKAEEDRTARQLLGREVDAIDREAQAEFDPFHTQRFVITDSDDEDKPGTKPRVKDKQPSKPCRPGKPSPSKPSKPIERTDTRESKLSISAKSSSSKKTPPRTQTQTPKATPSSKPAAVEAKTKSSPGPKHQLSTEPKRKVAQSPPTQDVKPKTSRLPTSAPPAKPRKRMQTKSESDLKASELLGEMEPPLKKRKFWESRPVH